MTHPLTNVSPYQASGSQARCSARHCCIRCAAVSGYERADVAKQATSAVEARVATGSNERWVAEAIARFTPAGGRMRSSDGPAPMRACGGFPE